MFYQFFSDLHTYCDSIAKTPIVITLGEDIPVLSETEILVTIYPGGLYFLELQL